MKRILLLVIICLLITPNIFAVSLSSAQGVAKEYMQEGEYLDTSFYYVSCDSNEFFVIGVIDSKENLSFFVPVESSNGNVVYQDTDKTKSIIKTAYLQRVVKTKKGNNYLSQQLLDRIDYLNTILTSKSAKLDGVISANYSATITQKASNTKELLGALISNLSTLHTNLSALQKQQSEFLDTPNCKKADDLLYLYKTAFSGYNNLIKATTDYRDSINEIIEVVVADKNTDETTKNILLSYIEAPSTLPSEISSLSDWLSSTNQFYQDIVSEFDKTGPNSSIELLVAKLAVRHDYYTAKTALYSYDSDLKDNLNNIITSILSQQNAGTWKDTKTLSELSQNYTQIEELFSKGKYTEAIPRISLAKSQVKKIVKEGTQEALSEPNYDYLMFVGIALLVLVLFIVLFKDINKKKKNRKKKSNVIALTDPETLLYKRDPFK